MNTTSEERKIKAIECMKNLDIYKPYIEEFKKNNKLTQFISYGGYYIEDKKLLKKIKEIEKENNITVYAVVPAKVYDMQTYSLLCVTDYKEEWPEIMNKWEDGIMNVFSYVYNETEELFSEFGNIGVSMLGGGLSRVY